MDNEVPPNGLDGPKWGLLETFSLIPSGLFYL